jgi:beta-phosphoglucomutase
MSMKTNILAVLWDLDGVLVDTGEAHFQSWANTLQDYHIPFSREKFKEIFGMHNESGMIYLIGKEAAASIWQEISDKKEIAFREVLRGKVELLPGVEQWLRRLYQEQTPSAIASSAPMENIDAIVDEAGIRWLFNAIISGVGHPGKPDPWVFEEAARQIDISPENCLVIEDSIAGVTGAKAGGMYCLGVTTTNRAEILRQAGADWVVDSLDGIFLKDL